MENARIIVLVIPFFSMSRPRKWRSRLAAMSLSLNFPKDMILQKKEICSLRQVYHRLYYTKCIDFRLR